MFVPLNTQASSSTVTENRKLPTWAGVQQKVPVGRGAPFVVNVAPAMPWFQVMVTRSAASASAEVMSKQKEVPAQTL